jgi:hypothetical protein
MAQEAKATPLQDRTATLQVQPITAAEEHQVVVVAVHTAAAPIVVVLHLADLVAEVAGLQVAAEEDNYISFF